MSKSPISLLHSLPGDELLRLARLLNLPTNQIAQSCSYHEEVRIKMISEIQTRAEIRYGLPTSSGSIAYALTRERPDIRHSVVYFRRPGDRFAYTV